MMAWLLLLYKESLIPIYRLCNLNTFAMFIFGSKSNFCHEHLVICIILWRICMKDLGSVLPKWWNSGHGGAMIENLEKFVESLAMT